MSVTTRHFPSAGYRGIVRVGDSETFDSSDFFLYSNSSIMEKMDIITPDVNGFPGRLGVVDGAITRAGDLTIPIISLTHLTTLITYFLGETERTKMRYIQLDNTFNKITFQGFMSTFRLSCQPGRGVEATIGIVGGIVDESTDVTPVTYASTDDTDHSDAWAHDTGIDTYISSIAQQIPFHRTKLNAVAAGDFLTNNYWKDVSGWDLTLDNQTQSTLVTAYGSADPQGYKIHQGQQIGTGSFTLINPFVSASDYAVADRNRPDLTGGLTIALTDSAGTTKTITVLRAVVSDYGVNMPAPNQRFTQTINYTITAGVTSADANILISYA